MKKFSLTKRTLKIFFILRCSIKFRVLHKQKIPKNNPIEKKIAIKKNKQSQGLRGQTSPPKK